MNKRLEGKISVAVPKVSHKRAKTIAVRQDRKLEEVVAACLAYGLKHYDIALNNYQDVQ